MKIIIVALFLMLMLCTATHGDDVKNYIEVLLKTPSNGYDINEYAITGAGGVGDIFDYKYSAIRQLTKDGLSEVDRLSLLNGPFTAELIGNRLLGFAQYTVKFDNLWKGESWEIALSLRHGGAFQGKDGPVKQMDVMDGGELKIRKEW